MLKRIDKYLRKQTPDSPPVLREMEQRAAEQGFPIVGPLVGRFLYQMALAIKARRIFEMGSGFGYSAFWFSMAVQAKGHIVMTDGDKARKRQAFDYFKRAGLQSQFEFRVGDARKIIKRYPGPFDIVFNDIDKEGYPDTIDLVAGRLRKGGLFITDNLLWDGRVCDRQRDGTTERIVEFTETLYRDSRFFTTILPLRDGVSLSVRL